MARAFRALSKKCLAGRPRGSAPPVVIQVRSGVLTLWSRVGSVGLRYAVAAPDAENETLLVPMDLLAAVESTRSDPVSLSVDAKLQGSASWTEDDAKSHFFRASAGQATRDPVDARYDADAGRVPVGDE